MRPNAQQLSLRIRWLVVALGVFAPAAYGGTLAVKFIDPDGRPIADAVATVHVAGAKQPPAAPVNVVVDQIERRFRPSVLGVPVGSRVSFPNSDAVSHQVYSFSPARRFQLPLYRGRPYPPVRFEVPGIVTLGCNIHDDMVAHILVSDAQYLGQTAADGAWTQRELPPGNYVLRLWHPGIRTAAKSLQRRISIAHASQDVRLVVQSDAAMRPGPAQGTRRFGSGGY